MNKQEIYNLIIKTIDRYNEDEKITEDEYLDILVKIRDLTEEYSTDLLSINYHLCQELEQYKNKVEYYENFEINKTVDKIRLRHNKEIKELYQKIDKYKNNWEELKKYAEELYNKEGSWASNGARYILNKMKELEEDK